ncbi:MAG: hypothetical protein EOP39_00290 [Rubrivivax sp.]|nr:MAG: hypothetical protein EOP39_00290 [Rubrivivax sp.]
MNPTRIVGASAPASAGSMDIQPIVDASLNAVRQATVQPGQYSRFIGDLAEQRPAGAQPRSHGSAAAACILYTVGHFPREPVEREAYVRYLRSGQSAESGFFADANHSATHAKKPVQRQSTCN